MKNFLLLAITAFSFSTLSNAQAKFGVQAGGILSEPSVNVSKGGSLFSNARSKSFQAGFIGEVPIAKHLYIQPQVLYTRRDFTLHRSTAPGDLTVRINYAELPVNLVYKVEFAFVKLFAGAGLSASYGFNGKQKENGVETKIYKDVYDWKRGDLNANLQAGVEFNNGLFLRATTQKGLINTSRIEGNSIKNKSLTLSLGYFLN